MQNYKILEQVGEGTYGRVFKAVDLRTNQLVALKQLFTLNKEEGLSYLAIQEIKYLKLLGNCQHVIKLLDAFAAKDADSNNNASESLCLVFPYASADLTGLLSVSTYSPTLSHIKCLFKQLLLGLQEIHKMNLMHRDIKAANLLIDNGRLVLGDVGMMTCCKQHGDFPSNVVTLWYRAPELLLGASRYGPEVDMWSAGCVLVELMTKKSPFPGHTEKQELDLIFKVMGTPDSSTWPGVDLLPGWPEVRQGLYKPQLRKAFADWDPLALDLLEKLLAPPHKRISAEQALQHPFFTASPLPSEPHELSGILPSMHEFRVKKRKSAAQPHHQHPQQQQQHMSYHADAELQARKRMAHGYAHPQYPRHPQHHQQRPGQYARPPFPVLDPSAIPGFVPAQSRSQPHPYPHQQQYAYPGKSHPHYSHHPHPQQQQHHHPQTAAPHHPHVVHVQVPFRRESEDMHMFHNGGIAQIPSSAPSQSSSSVPASKPTTVDVSQRRLVVAPRTKVSSLSPQAPTHPQESPDRPSSQPQPQSQPQQQPAMPVGV